MDIILLQNVDSLGRKGSLAKVKNGYARNFLFPRKLAELATPGRLKNMEKEKASDRRRYESEIVEAKKIQGQINGLAITLTRKVSEKGKLFGSVSPVEVAAEVGRLVKIDLDKKQIKMDLIKTLGEFTITVRLLPEVTSAIKVTVLGENGETAESIAVAEAKRKAELEAAYEAKEKEARENADEFDS